MNRFKEDIERNYGLSYREDRIANTEVDCIFHSQCFRLPASVRHLVHFDLLLTGNDYQVDIVLLNVSFGCDTMGYLSKSETGDAR